MIDMMKPAGWKGERGGGLEKSRAMSPPTIEPAMPRIAVSQKPRCSASRKSCLATKPTMKPTMMDQMMCSIGWGGCACLLAERLREILCLRLHDFLFVLRVGVQFVELRFPRFAVNRESHG